VFSAGKYLAARPLNQDRLIYSSTGKQLSDRRRKLGDDIVEAQEILKSLMRNGLLQFEQAVSIIRVVGCSSEARKCEGLKV
jgi:hypothetical protein